MYIAPTSPAPQHTRDALHERIDGYLDALAARDPSPLGDTTRTRHGENNVALAIGDGAWGTVDAATATMRFADPAVGAAVAWGTLDEAGESSPFALRIRLDGDGSLVESELVVLRRLDLPRWSFLAPEIPARPDFLGPGAPGADRAGMIARSDDYFRTLERNDGTVHARLDPACVRRENGVLTADNPAEDAAPMWRLSCHAQFEAGFYGANDRVRDRRYHMVDEEAGVVLATVFIDHGGSRALLQHRDGSTQPSRYRRPHSLYVIELLRIRDDAIVGIEALHMGVPYAMPPALRLP